MITFSEDCQIDLPRLLETRLLVQANSGGGKSWVLRRLLEQTVSHVQQLVIDPEGEFSTLRERFDYVVCAPHDADAVAHPRTAKLLARRLLETGVSAILDIYDLRPHERKEFVRLFCEALVDAPKALWHPVLVVIDEAHVYAPEKGRAASDSLGAIIDLATRGRKRGYCLCAATQRLSKLHKDVAAEMNNKLIGRTGLDVDISRAGDELGMTKRDATQALKFLDEGEWWVFGPALSRDVRKIKVGDVQTTHPKAGERLLKAPPAPSSKVKAVLAELADLPQQAEQEANTVEELKRQLREARHELNMAARPTEPGISEAEVQRRIDEAIAQVEPEPIDTTELELLLEQLAGKVRDLQGSKPRISTPKRAAPPIPVRKIPAQSAKVVSEDSDLNGPEQRILDSLAWFEAIGISTPDNTAVAFMADYKPKGGAFNNPRGRLNKRGLISYPGKGQMCLTESGRELAQFPDVQPTNDAMHQQVLSRLPGPEQRLLRPLLDAYPNPLSNEELAERAGYAPTGGAFGNPRGRLRSLGLIDYAGRGYVVARHILFPEGKP